MTDPPYGIREPASKVGSTKDQIEAIPDEYLDNHIPQKIDYGLGDIFVDLMAFANLHMLVKGRLAFWMPVNREFYSEDMVSTMIFNFTKISIKIFNFTFFSNFQCQSFFRCLNFTIFQNSFFSYPRTLAFDW